MVIPHYGDPDLVSGLIASLKSKSSGRPVQFVVSDDASPQPFTGLDGVEVLRSEINGGFGAAVNRGVAIAENPWLLIMNSDVVADPAFIDRLIAAAAEFQPALCGVAQYVPALDAWPPPAMRYPTSLSTAMLHSSTFRPLVRTRLGRHLSRMARPEDQRTGPVEWVGGAVMLVPTDAFRMVGGFDERYFMYMEEVDLQRRLQGLGVASVYLHDLKVVHEAGMSSGGVDKELQQWRSRFLYERRWNGRAGEQLLWGLMCVIVWLDAVSDALKASIGRPHEHPGHPRDRLNVLRRARRAAQDSWTLPTRSEVGHAIA